MKRLMLATLMLAGSSLFGQVSVGVRIGPPPPPPAVVVRRPPAPGPGYYWVEPYYDWRGGRYVMVRSYWARPPYAGGYWVGPRYEGGRYYRGYWERGHHDRDDYR